MIDFHDLSACFCDFHPGMDEFSLSILYNYPCISARKNRFSQNPWSILSVVFSASVIISWFIVKAASTWEDLLKRWAPTARATTPWASEYATLAAYPRLASQRIPAPPRAEGGAESAHRAAEGGISRGDSSWPQWVCRKGLSLLWCEGGVWGVKIKSPVRSKSISILKLLPFQGVLPECWFNSRAYCSKLLSDAPNVTNWMSVI